VTSRAVRWQGIVKVQRALYPENGDILVYSRNRKVHQLFAQSPELLELLAGDYKIFVRASLGQDGVLRLGSRVPDPGW